MYMNKLILISILFSPVVLFVLSCSTSSDDENPLNLEISYPVNNEVFRNNVVELTGTVDPENSDVTVQGIRVEKNDFGEFFHYLDLVPGTNTIVVNATYNGQNISRKIEVGYLPALAVRCHTKEFTCDQIDEDLLCVTLKGFVTVPQASVVVNGSQVSVSNGGTFSRSMKLKPENDITIVRTVATFGEEKDIEIDYLGDLTVPGQGGQYVPRITWPDDIDIHIGETKTAEMQFTTGRLKSSNYPCECSFEIYNLKGDPILCGTFPPDDSCKQSLPEGLDVVVKPSLFTIYANTTYHPNLVISASNELKPKKYVVTLQYHCDYLSSDWFYVNVNN